MPIDLRLGERERAELLRGVEVLVSQPLAEEGGAPFHIADPDEDELALVVHTSGTTRTPRPVELTFGNLAAHVRAPGPSLGHRSRRALARPDAAVARRRADGARPQRRGGGHGRARAAAVRRRRVARLLREGDITLASLVPTMLARVLDAGGRPGPRLRRVLLGGGPCRPALLKRAVEAGFPISQTYGLTEAGSTVTLADPGDLETAGRPLPGLGVEHRRRRRDLRQRPDRGGGVGRCARATSGGSTSEGRLTVVGRKSDTIVSGGENVAPAEVEAVLEEHPRWRRRACSRRAHPTWGESVTARIVPRGERRADRRRAARALRRAARGLQGAEGVRAGRAAPAHRLWQAAAARADMTVPDDYRKESRVRWGAQARGWGAQAERLAAVTMPVSVWMVDALELQPGHEVLELAAGTGEVGFLAAEQIAARRHARSPRTSCPR